MQDQSKQVRSENDRRVEQVIVLLILLSDHAERWSRAELEAELDHHAPSVIGDALARLKAEGVVHLSRDVVWASRATRRLDELGMIAI